MAQPVGHELLDPYGWDAQPSGVVGLIFGDRRAGDIVAVARALFDGVARGHLVTVGVAEPSELVLAQVVLDDREAVLVELGEATVHVEIGRQMTGTRQILSCNSSNLI